MDDGKVSVETHEDKDVDAGVGVDVSETHVQLAHPHLERPIIFDVSGKKGIESLETFAVLEKVTKCRNNVNVAGCFH